jgi:hypothetical protein
MGIRYSSRSESRSYHKIILESHTLLLTAFFLPRLLFLSLDAYVRRIRELTPVPPRITFLSVHRIINLDVGIV